jgi:serine/threonine-protein kinase HipA
MKEILVYADWDGLATPTKMGVLTASSLRGKEVFTFRYDSSWLASNNPMHIDPNLNFYSGPQYLQDDKPNFGLFLDSSPDRWGRVLMKRREALLARLEDRPIQVLKESDYLLGVNDETRMGALRLKLGENEPFLAHEPNLEVPPFTSIRTLEEASLQIEEDDFFEKKDARKWLQILITPGSSLGGARPKANVRDPKGHLWIAKFPSKNDEWDIGAWEYIVNRLAKKAGINTTNAMARKFSQRQHTYLSCRFDRTTNGKRIHFASAMTLLGYKDGYDHHEGGTYLEILELLERFSAKPNDDIRELWRRIVFSVLVSNTDDHLRNHGFLLTKTGWRLSPAYDINPNPQGSGLSLNISDTDNSLSLELCLEMAPFFRWQQEPALAYIKEASQIVSEWSNIAKERGISRAEQLLMSNAFVRAAAY